MTLRRLIKVNSHQRDKVRHFSEQSNEIDPSEIDPNEIVNRLYVLNKAINLLYELKRLGVDEDLVDYLRIFIEFESLYDNDSFYKTLNEILLRIDEKLKEKEQNSTKNIKGRVEVQKKKNEKKEENKK